MIELVEHTGELELHARNVSLGAVIDEVLAALAAEVTDGPAVPGTERRCVAVSAPGADGLLVEVVNRAIYLMDTERFVATGVKADRLTDTALEGVFVGHRDPDLRPLAKAATYHNLSVEAGPAGWEAHLVLDV